MLLAAGMLHRAGIAALLVDLRNHGDSTVVNGRFAGGTREFSDALAGWDWLVNARGFTRDRVGLFGQSLGAATALIATGEEPRVGAVWADSTTAIWIAIQAELTRNGYPTFVRYGGYAMAWLRSGDDLLSLSPLGAVAKLDGRPIVHHPWHGRHAALAGLCGRPGGGCSRARWLGRPMDGRGRGAHPGDRPPAGRVRPAARHLLPGRARRDRELTRYTWVGRDSR